MTIDAEKSMVVKRIDPHVDLRINGDRLDVWKIGSVRSFSFPDAEKISKDFAARFHAGVLTPDDEMFDSPFTAFLQEQGVVYTIPKDLVDSPEEELFLTVNRLVSIADISSRLKKNSVLVVGDCTMTDDILSNLDDLGVNASREDPDSELGMFENVDLVVVVTKSLLDPHVQKINDFLLENERRIVWLPVFHQLGNSVLVGPFIHPHKTACLECLRLRLTSTIGEIPDWYVNPGAPLMEYGDRFINRETPLEKLACNLVAQMIQNKLALCEYSGLSRPGFLQQLSVDNKGFHSVAHRVLKAPRCESCSESSRLGYPQVWHHGALS